MTERERLLDELRPGWVAIVLAAEQRLNGVRALGIAVGQITGVNTVLNPDNLTHLGRVAGLWELLRTATGPGDRT